MTEDIKGLQTTHSEDDVLNGKIRKGQKLHFPIFKSLYCICQARKHHLNVLYYKTFLFRQHLFQL